MKTHIAILFYFLLLLISYDYINSGIGVEVSALIFFIFISILQTTFMVISFTKSKPIFYRLNLIFTVILSYKIILEGISIASYTDIIKFNDFIQTSTIITVVIIGQILIYKTRQKVSTKVRSIKSLSFNFNQIFNHDFNEKSINVNQPYSKHQVIKFFNKLDYNYADDILEYYTHINNWVEPENHYLASVPTFDHIENFIGQNSIDSMPIIDFALGCGVYYATKINEKESIIYCETNEGYTQICIGIEKLLIHIISNGFEFGEKIGKELDSAFIKSKNKDFNQK